jgi:hypothetical protein
MLRKQNFSVCILSVLFLVLSSTNNVVFSDSTNMIVNGNFSKGTDGWNLVTLSGGEASFSAQKGWLVYGYSKKWGNGEGGTKPHYMVGRRIKFKKNN